jgi:hypothetical protein
VKIREQTAVGSLCERCARTLLLLRLVLPDFSILNEIARLNGALTRELGGLISTHALRGKTLKDPRHPFQQ